MTRPMWSRLSLKDDQFFNIQRQRLCTSCQLEQLMKPSVVAGLSLLSTSPSAPRFVQRSGFANSVLPEDRLGTEGLYCVPWKLPWPRSDIQDFADVRKSLCVLPSCAWQVSHLSPPPIGSCLERLDESVMNAGALLCEFVGRSLW